MLDHVHHIIRVSILEQFPGLGQIEKMLGRSLMKKVNDPEVLLDVMTEIVVMTGIVEKTGTVAKTGIEVKTEIEMTTEIAEMIEIEMMTEIVEMIEIEMMIETEEVLDKMIVILINHHYVGMVKDLSRGEEYV